MIPDPGIMIWLVKSLIVDIFEMNIWQIFENYATPTVRYNSAFAILFLSFDLLTSRYFTNDSGGYLMLCYKEEF